MEEEQVAVVPHQGGGPSPSPGRRRRTLCSLRSPFWWLGSTADDPPRPGGDPRDYDPRPASALCFPEEIPDLLGRLEVECESQYLPGQLAVHPDPAPRGPLTEQTGETSKSHEHCSCRRETWVRGGPLGENRPDPSKGCQCACCKPKEIEIPQPLLEAPCCNRPPPETWQPRPPFWWWCHDRRARRPVGNPSLYTAVFPRKIPQAEPPLNESLEVDHPCFYLPGQIAFGFKPALIRYWRPPEDGECYFDYDVVSGLVESPDSQHDEKSFSCSEHGGHPAGVLPSLLCTEVPEEVTERLAWLTGTPQPPRDPPPEVCATCCRHSSKSMANILPYGWRGWPGVKEGHMFYRDLDPNRRVAHCSRCLC